MRLPRHRRVPTANDPRRLGRLLELLAGGLRDPRSLAMALGCETRTVHTYTQAGEWLGFLEPGPPPRLSPLGLEWVYAPRRRRAIYARAVWSNPLVRDLMAGRQGELPPLEEVEAWIRRVDPTLARATARRRASAVRGLVAPGVAALRPGRPLQLELPLGFPPARRRVASGLRAPGGRDAARGPACALDRYLPVAVALLDRGELDPGQVRAVLDAAGFPEATAGEAMAMAVRRGDARRVAGRLVVTPGAIRRREVMATVAGLALSDPEYRAYLEILLAAAGGDLGAGRRLRAVRERFEDWDRRVFGRTAPDAVTRVLDGILLGRGLERFPLAGDAGPEPVRDPRPFVEAFGSAGLLLVAPSGLADLAGGLEVARRLAEVAARRRSRPAAPSVLDPVEVVHGGLLHPGEPRVPVIPDRGSLRLRALTRAPAIALLVVLLLLHRRSGLGVELVRGGDDLRVLRMGVDQGSFWDVVEAFGREQGWWFSRPGRGPDLRRLEGAGLAEAARSLGIAVDVGELLVLDDAFFHRLRSEPEDRLAARALGPLEDRVQGFLEAL